MAKKKTRSSKGILPAVAVVSVLAVLIIIGIIIVANNGSDGGNLDQNTQDVKAENNSSDSEKTIKFPAVLDGGNLKIESLFQFSGINPDAGKQEAADVASIILENTSESYLKTAKVTAVLGDGSELVFVVNDLPAGKSAMAFSVDNDKLSDGAVCTGISVEPVFEEIENSDGVKISVDGTTVTLENISGQTLSGIDIYCRDVFNDEYFGGVAYKYTIDKLPAGESTAVTVSASVMGLTDVVRITVNDQK